MFCFILTQLVHAKIQEGADTPPPPLEKSKQYLTGSPEKSQCYQASNQCRAIIGPPAKRHFNGVSLAIGPLFVLHVFISSLSSFKLSDSIWQNYLDPRM